MNEFLHGPLWVLDEDGISHLDKVLPSVENDVLVRELAEAIGSMYDSYYAFDSHDCGCWFDQMREMDDAEEMLDLAWCLYARVCELNDGSFVVDDQLIPNLEHLVELKSRANKLPKEIESFYEGDAYFPIQVKFDLPAADRRYARFVTEDGRFLEFWIQNKTNLPEELYLDATSIEFSIAGEALHVPTCSNMPVYLGFSGDVHCKGIDTIVYEDGIVIYFREHIPVEWRRAGNVFFGYDESMNLLSIAFGNISKEKMRDIREWIASR